MNGGDNRQWRWLFLLSGLVALIVAIWFFPKVFPISGLRIRVPRAEAAQIASRFLQQAGVQVPADYTRVTTFDIDSGAKAYLEQTLGIAAANRVAQEQGFVYVWYTRWFRPGKEREFVVAVDPDGRVLSFQDRLPTDAPAPPSRQPERIAQEFVERTLGLDLQNYRLIEESETPRTARKEYGYTWEKTTAPLAEARERIRIVVTGDRVVYFLRHLHYPEKFTHTFRWHRTRGSVIALIATGFTAIFGVILVLVLLFGAARKELRWRIGLVPAAVVTLVYLLNFLNGLPLRIAAMDTDQTWGAFWVGDVLLSVFGSLFAGLRILLIVTAAEWLYRQAFPQAIPLQHWFSRQGWAHPEGRKRIALGYWLFATHLLYIVAFTAGARRLLGAWDSATVPYDDLLSTVAPWAYPMLTAVVASIGEEFLFRVFLISLFQRYLRSAWAGIIVSAVVWSALHCTYPTVPYYLRAVELIPVGILLGWFVMRFGPLPTLISHAAYNAAISSDIFLYNTELLPRLSFGVVVLFILLPALLTWRWARSAQAEAALEPVVVSEAESPPAVVETAVPAKQEAVEREVIFPTLGRKRLWLAVFAFALVVVLSFGWDELEERQQRFKWARGEHNPLRMKVLDARQAVEVARQYLPQKGAEVKGWTMVVGQEDDRKEEDYRYLRRFLSKPDADALWARVRSPDNLWAVRWWKPGGREEWWVLLTPEGKFWERYCSMPEEAPGKRISRAEAQQLATQALHELGFPLDRMRLVSSSGQDLPARSFHTFRWQIEGLEIGKARFQVVVGVEGDVVTGVYREIDIPSSYLFQKEVSTIRQVTGAFTIFAVGLILFVWSLRVHVRLLRQYQAPWRWALRPALALSILPLVLLILDLPSLATGTPTTLTPQAFTISIVFVLLVFIVILFIGILFYAPYVPAWRTVFPDLPDPMEWWQALTQPRRYRRVWREAIVAQAAPWVAPAVPLMLIRAVELLALPGGKKVAIPSWIVQMKVNETDSAVGILAYSPELFTLAWGVFLGLVALFLWLGLAISFKLMFGTVRKCFLWYLLLLAPGCLLFSETWEAVQYLIGVLSFFGVGWLLYRWILRWNPLTLFVLGLHFTLVKEGYALLYYESHRAGGVLLWFIVAGFLLWALVGWWRERRQAQALPTMPESSPELNQ